MEEGTPRKAFIPYDTEAEAYTKIAVIDAKYGEMWAYRSTTTYANPSGRIDGKFYVPVIAGFEGEFTEEEIGRGVEAIPKSIDII